MFRDSDKTSSLDSINLEKTTNQIVMGVTDVTNKKLTMNWDSANGVSDKTINIPTNLISGSSFIVTNTGVNSQTITSAVGIENTLSVNSSQAKAEFKIKQASDTNYMSIAVSSNGDGLRIEDNGTSIIKFKTAIANDRILYTSGGTLTSHATLDPTNIAVKNADNNFSVSQTLPGLTVSGSGLKKISIISTNNQASLTIKGYNGNGYTIYSLLDAGGLHFWDETNSRTALKLLNQKDSILFLSRALKLKMQEKPIKIYMTITVLPAAISKDCVDWLNATRGSAV
jgi:hypothetical protein